MRRRGELGHQFRQQDFDSLLRLLERGRDLRRGCRVLAHVDDRLDGRPQAGFVDRRRQRQLLLDCLRFLLGDGLPLLLGDRLRWLVGDRLRLGGFFGFQLLVFYLHPVLLIVLLNAV